MSDFIHHECGIVMIRLLKPLSFYQEKYKTPFFGLNKLQLIMEKMRNRGQDGAGMATIKLNTVPGHRYISRRRSNAPQPLKDLYEGIFSHFKGLSEAQLSDATWLKENMPYMGELLMGHLRYGTHGENTIEQVHPFLRQNNWINRNLLLAGNFNLTNVDELFDELVELGQYPKEKSDTVTVLEKIGHFLDDEVQRLHTWYKPEGYSNEEINGLIFDQLNIQTLLKRASKKFDGGYVMGGMIGHGDAFMMRDPNGIRPAFIYQDDEVVVIASERPPIMSAFGVTFDKIRELKPGHAIILKHNGIINELPFIEEKELKAAKLTPCSFERIYFSRGNDREIYRERKKLGELLAKPILQSINFDLDNTVFSFIPNTAEVAFFGLVEGLNKHLDQKRKEEILALKGTGDEEKIENIFRTHVRIEKLAVKDEKLRTFITDDASRGDLVSHVYDVTYGIVRDGIDTLVLVDDSIVRGTTLRDSILNILSRLRPKKIIIASSAPQIRYPDCYGIDMSKMKEFVAFRALVDLLESEGKENLLEEAYQRCKESLNKPEADVKNEVQSLYELYTADEISKRIAEIVTPLNIFPDVEVVFQSLEGLHEAIPVHKGDWYFSGNYPTPGGKKVVNKAFMLFMEGSNARAY
jgi:amidophosphoribosyltransferase